MLFRRASGARAFWTIALTFGVQHIAKGGKMRPRPPRSDRVARRGACCYLLGMGNSQDTSHGNPLLPAPRKGFRGFVIALLFVALGLACYVLQPFVSPIILGVVLAGLVSPIQARLLLRLGGRKNIAALATILLVVLLIILPTILIAGALVDQGVQVSAHVKEWMAGKDMSQVAQHEFFVQILCWIQGKLPFLELDKINVKAGLLGLAKGASEFVLSHGASLLGNAARLFTNFFVMLFVAFYCVRDGEAMVSALKHLSPMRAEQEDRILQRIRAVARSVFMGSLLTAVCQGVAGGIALSLVGVPGLFWGAMMGFASLIPVVGTALVWIPAAGYLLLLGFWGKALFLAAWSVVLVGSIDNFLRPMFMRGGAEMSPFYIFLAILGGVQVFGLAGLLYGPLVIGFAKVMLDIYESEFRAVLLHADSDDGPCPAVTSEPEAAPAESAATTDAPE